MIPAADVRIDLPLVRSLLARQAPQWAELQLRPAASGWDNVMVRLGEELAVRLPRRAAAAPLLRSEAAWAPVLAPQLPLPIPVPRFLGAPQGEYPYPWLVTTWLQGEPTAAFPAEARDGYAGELAGFLAAFHTVPDAAGPGPAAPLASGGGGAGGVVGAASGRALPYNPVRGVPVAERVRMWRARLREACAVEGPLAGVSVHGQPQAQRLAATIDAAQDASAYQGPPVWVHGDPHPLNTLAGEGEASTGQRGSARRTVGLGLTGVVDLGDLTVGDPASDLGAAWLHFTPAGLSAFRDAYALARPEAGEDAGLWDRAAGWAVNCVLTLLGDASELGDCARTALAAHWPTEQSLRCERSGLPSRGPRG